MKFARPLTAPLTLTIVIAAAAAFVALAINGGPSLTPQPAEATFHCMRIHAVMGGANGNANIQYVELRLQAGNNFVAGTQLKFFNAMGGLTTTFTVPSTPTTPNGANGASILIATGGLDGFTANATVTPDFTFSAANTEPDNLHPISASGGKIQFTGSFDCTISGSTIIDSVAYGSIAAADFGTPAVPMTGLPTSGASALTLNTLCFPNQMGCTRANQDDYSLTTAAPRNNAGQTGSICNPGPCPTPTPTPVPTATPVPTPTPTPGTGDSDGDGKSDASDNCPNWPNPAQNLPPWTVPANDPDCDGFSTATETFVGTLPLVHCAQNSDPNNENPDAWPTDNNDDQLANLADILAYIPVFNSMGPGAPYNARYDINEDSVINLADVLKFIPFFNSGCVP